jgi:hypothetical protein
MRSYQLAGLSDDAGKLRSPLQARQYPPPDSIKLSGGMLVWRVDEVFMFDNVRDGLQKKKQQDPELLFKFIKLTHASPTEILKFATRWGPLGICKHGLPYTHVPPPMSEIPEEYWCTPMRNRNGDFYEPISAWHYYSRQARSMINIAANLHQDKPGELDDWNAIYDLGPSGNGRGQGLYLNDDKHFIALRINFWLELGNVRPKFQWRQNDIVVSYDSHLFGALASQLLMLVSRTKGLGVCSSCGNPFIPSKRRPKTNQRNYCATCKKRGAWRDAQRDRRRRLKEEP